MRAAQYRILTRLLEPIEVPDYVFAFERGRSVPVMAQIHVGMPLVISLDLKDFFPSIKQWMLHALFQGLGASTEAARTLSEVCTYGAFVPQGALTSPKLSNIISATTFGPTLKKYCDDRGYNLSIYADDVTISTPRDLIAEEGQEAVTQIIEFVTATVGHYGFRVNKKKTKVMRRSQRQYVCGAVVNSRVNLQRKQRNRLRAMVHNVSRNGVQAEAAKSGVSPEKFLSTLMGHVNWFHQLNEDAGGQLKAQLKRSIGDQTMVSERVAPEEGPSSHNVVTEPSVLQELCTPPAPWAE